MFVPLLSKLHWMHGSTRQKSGLGATKNSIFVGKKVSVSSGMEGIQRVMAKLPPEN